MIEVCQNCRFFEYDPLSADGEGPSTASRGLCCANPPTVLEAAADGYGYTAWPQVQGHRFCGRHEVGSPRAHMRG
jgi:hypothetical protein